MISIQLARELPTYQRPSCRIYVPTFFDNTRLVEIGMFIDESIVSCRGQLLHHQPARRMYVAKTFGSSSKNNNWKEKEKKNVRIAIARLFALHVNAIRVKKNSFSPYLVWAFLVLLIDRGPKKFPFLKICHTNPTKMKLATVIPYLKRTLYHVMYFFYSADFSIFSLEISHLCYIKKCRYRLHFNT